MPTMNIAPWAEWIMEVTAITVFALSVAIFWGTLAWGGWLLLAWSVKKVRSR